MSSTPTPIEYFRSVVRERRFIQNSWHKQIDGKEYVCLAAAWGEPGTINSTADCPVNLFPRWVFELMPTLDDGVAKDDVKWLFEGFSQRADKMAKFSTKQWERIRTSFLIGVIDIAVDVAQAVQPIPAPKYWLDVVKATKQVKLALVGQGSLAAADAAAARAARAADAAARAARAADAAAYAAAYAAARAARAAAYAAADAAAYAAARAARAADAAADAAAYVAAYAARGNTYKQIASVFFACIDTEVM